jgi:putative peptide zinc metalloprotease protein
MDQRQSGWLFMPDAAAAPGHSLDAAAMPWKAVEVRLVSDVDTVFEATNVRPTGMGEKLLPSAAMGYTGGGGVEIDPKDKSGRVAKRPIFTVRMDALPESTDKPLESIVTPGERVRVRFKLPNRPLLAQWIDRLEKEIQGRVKL